MWRQVTFATVGSPGVFEPNRGQVALAYSHDAAGNLQSVSAAVAGQPDLTNTYAYDALSRTTTLVQTGPGVSDKRVDFTYKKDNQFDVISRYASSTASSANLVATSTYGYDGAGRLTSLDDFQNRPQ